MTLIDEPLKLERVAFIVVLVVPTVTAPKLTGARRTVAGRGVPWMGAVCGFPEALSVTLIVALLLPGVAGFAK